MDASEKVIMDPRRDPELVARLQEMKRTCEKIVQAYRIRLKCLGQRHNLLISVNQDFNNMNDAFFSKLRRILKNEKRLIDIIKGDETNVRNTIQKLVRRLEEYVARYGKKDLNLQSITIREGYGDANGVFRNVLSARLFRKFMKKIISFLGNINSDLSAIENRMKYEEAFLKSRKSEHFKLFIEAWEQESWINAKTARKFHNLLVDNLSVLRKIETDRSAEENYMKDISRNVSDPLAKGLLGNVGVGILEIQAAQCTLIFRLLEGLSGLTGHKGLGDSWLNVGSELDLLERLKKSDAIRKNYWERRQHRIDTRAA